MAAPSPSILDIDLQLPHGCDALFDRSLRNIGLVGGRGSAKSHTVGRVWLIDSIKEPMRNFCFREIQKSIKASVHQLLADLIRDMNIGAHYNVQNEIIRGYNGSEFTFHGMHGNADAIKSAEGADRGWIEEAQTVSQGSLDILIPTIRKPGSQIWATWNPRFPTDAIHQTMIVNPSPGTRVIRLNWRDNPWFPKELDVERRHMRATDRKRYDHIWEGQFQSAAEGAIFEKEVAAALHEGRVRSLPVDLTRPVHTFWDLGYGDRNAIWLAQAVGGWYNFIDYIEGNARTISSYLLELDQRAKERGFLFGHDWVPHDALDTELHKKLTGDRTRSVEMIMRQAGRRVRLVPKMRVQDGINAARLIFPQSRFDVDRCSLGLHALQMYQWGPPTAHGAERSQPLHDQNSHGADAFRAAGLCLKEESRKPKPTPSAGPASTSEWM